MIFEVPDRTGLSLEYPLLDRKWYVAARTRDQVMKTLESRAALIWKTPVGL